MVSKGIVQHLEKLIKDMKYKDDEVETVNRVINLLSKIARDP